jgi:hypothetical protein
MWVFDYKFITLPILVLEDFYFSGIRFELMILK